MEPYMLPCLNKKYLGFECLGCGIQRALARLLQGDFLGAFQMYPALYPLISLVLILAYSSIFKLKHDSKIISILGVISVLMILANYAVKHWL